MTEPITGDWAFTPTPFGKIAGALAEAHKSFKPIIRSKEVKVTSVRTNTQYKFKYAPYEEMVEATGEALRDNGLSVFSTVEGYDKDCVLAMYLIHSSGESIRCAIPMPALPTGLTAQELGSHLSYRMRYAYRHLLNLPADEDDDGNVADNNDFEVTKERGRTASVAGDKAVPAAPKKSAKYDPAAKLDALKRQANAILQQLALAGLIDVLAIKSTQEGQAVRDTLRTSLLHSSEFNPESEDDVEKWVEALRKYRDDNTPPPGL